MCDFKELCEPQREYVPIAKPRLRRWYVTATDHRFLVNDGKSLSAAGATLEENEKLYFYNSIEAFFYSAKYYSLHQKEFPYHDEWQAAIDGNKPSAVPTGIESKVMKFK